MSDFNALEDDDDGVYCFIKMNNFELKGVVIKNKFVFVRGASDA